MLSCDLCCETNNDCIKYGDVNICNSCVDTIFSIRKISSENDGECYYKSVLFLMEMELLKIRKIIMSGCDVDSDIINNIKKCCLDVSIDDCNLNDELKVYTRDVISRINVACDFVT